MKRYQTVLCVLAAIATVAAFWGVCVWFYRQLVAIALFLLILALIAMTF